MGFDPAACTLGGHPKASSCVARDRKNVLEQVNRREARDHRDLSRHLARPDDPTRPRTSSRTPSERPTSSRDACDGKSVVEWGETPRIAVFRVANAVSPYVGKLRLARGRAGPGAEMNETVTCERPAARETRGRILVRLVASVAPFFRSRRRGCEMGTTRSADGMEGLWTIRHRQTAQVLWRVAATVGL